MSYAPRGPGRPRQYAADQNEAVGSVRAARERLAREQERREGSSRTQNVQYPTQTPPQQPLSPTSQYSRPPMESPPPQSFSPRSQYALNPGSAERLPQWPSRAQTGSPRLPLQGIGAPPQSPPPTLPEFAPNDARPVYVDRQRANQLTPPLQVPMEDLRHVKTFSQVSSTSLGSIPDFPVPVNTSLQIPQQNSNSRPGYSSYYTQSSNNVAPIREESGSRGSTRSYASSTIPKGAPRIPDFYYEEVDRSDDDQIPERISPVPVRTASVGRRGKPSVLAIRSSKGRDNRELKEVMLSSSEEALVEKDDVPNSRNSVSRIGLNSPTSRSSKRLDAYLNDLEKEAALLKQVQKSTLSARVGSRIPAPLNVNAVRDAESRGSLTSLPELIRRATKLAANLDRGRTASRLGLEWMVNDTDMDLKNVSRVNESEKLDHEDTVHSGTTLREQTPRDEWRSPRSNRRRTERDRYDNRQRSKAAPPPGRRCCGMDLKYFLGTLIILTLLVAAAVVIPVVLIVIPKKHAHSVSDGSCSSTLVCQNGGVSTTLAGGTCICLCSDGYSGFICQNSPEPACTTIDAPNYSKATIGTLIPPLIDSANSNFSIPLVKDTLLMRFAEFNFTCPVANALVTFPSLPNKRMIEVRQQATNGAAATSTAANSAATDSAATGTSLGQASWLTGATNSSTNNFARVGLLFILQDSDSLAITQMAQQNLYSFLQEASKNESTIEQAQNVTLGSGYVINLWDWTVKLQNGTVYGNGWNGTATSATAT